MPPLYKIRAAPARLGDIFAGGGGPQVAICPSDNKKHSRWNRTEFMNQLKQSRLVLAQEQPRHQHRPEAGHTRGGKLEMNEIIHWTFLRTKCCWCITLMFECEECLRCRPSLGVPELESSERVSERERSFSAFVLVSQNCIGPCCSAAELQSGAACKSRFFIAN